MKSIIITVIITILISTVGIMGFLLWQGGRKQIKNNSSQFVADVDYRNNQEVSILNDTADNCINNTTQDNRKDLCETEDKAYFSIPELGIKILVNKDVKDDLIYEFDKTGDVKYVTVSFKSLIKKVKGQNNNCLPENGGAFAISRLPINDDIRKNPGGVKIFGDEYVRFDRQDRCSFLDKYENMLINKSMVVAVNHYQCIKELNNAVIKIQSKNNSQEDILSAINKAGYKMLPSNYDGSSYDINKRNNIFLLTRRNELFIYNKSNGNVVKINSLSIPDGWDVIVRRSVTIPNDFVVSFILKEELTNPGMFEYKIVDTQSYLVDGNGVVEVIAKKLSDSINDFFSCEVLDSYNKRFLTWYCGEGLGSVAPVIAVDYNGKKIHSVLEDDPYFSHRGDENSYVVNIKVNMHNPNQLTANKYNNNNNNLSQKIFYIKENLIK